MTTRRGSLSILVGVGLAALVVAPAPACTTACLLDGTRPSRPRTANSTLRRVWRW